MTRPWIVIFFMAAVGGVRADGPGDNSADKVRRVPPPGINIPAAERQGLEAGSRQLGQDIEALRMKWKGKQAMLDLLPDVQVFHNAVRYALAYNEFYNPADVKTAQSLLKQGLERASQLRDGKSTWTVQTGLVVRGYLSKIDGSVQPYGLVVPASYRPDAPFRHRVDVWCHGRGENLTELKFIEGHQKSPGEFTPPHAFVLHPYGRYCNANKFAGEIDLFEALDHVRKYYPIDENRLVVRGFSMGGAACWQFAVHYPGTWAAAAPGAGFSETQDFLKVFQNEAVEPAWYEQKLWHMYDCTDYAINLFNCPTVAYSGELDRQKQAADKMAEALAKEGIALAHIIGPKTAHAYHPQARLEINRRIDSIAAKGRNPVPRELRFTTWTLRYNQLSWLTVDGLDKHWERARVNARLDNTGALFVQTDNVTALTLSVPPGWFLLDNTQKLRIVFEKFKSGPDSQEIVDAPMALSDRSWTAHFRKLDNNWRVVPSNEDGALRKRHGLQGPIDDAFMDSFIMVQSTGKPLNDTVGTWADGEMKHAIDHWRRQFRGEARVIKDDQVTEADIAGSNLVLWGDPHSNKILAKIADHLPIRWESAGVRVGDQRFSAEHHVPVFIYPNPLNPRRYVVVNSGFTFREYDYLNNARQVSKLPDFAVIDLNEKPSSRTPGKVVIGGFFGERWELPEGKK